MYLVLLTKTMLFTNGCFSLHCYTVLISGTSLILQLKIMIDESIGKRITIIIILYQRYIYII